MNNNIKSIQNDIEKTLKSKAEEIKSSKDISNEDKLNYMTDMEKILNYIRAYEQKTEKRKIIYLEEMER